MRGVTVLLHVVKAFCLEQASKKAKNDVELQDLLKEILKNPNSNNFITLIEALANARLDGSYIKWLNQIARTPLLIIDDFGLQPIDHNIKLALLQILEDRYGKGSTIITSQLPVKAWYEHFQ